MGKHQKMVTEKTYQILRVHTELVTDWKKKNQTDLAEHVISSLIFGIGFGFGCVFSLQLILLSIDTFNTNWLIHGLTVSTFLSIGMYISERSPKPSIQDAKFIVSARKTD